MNQLSLGVMARSLKENERRLPLHPDHFGRIPDDLRGSVYLERGYGDGFGVSDDQLKSRVAGLRTREQLVAECDVILQPKPLLRDIAEMRVGQVLWGWPHCVQDKELTQLAIEQELTLIAFEAMNHWNSDGSFNLHVFHKNNELAGYCSVLHAMKIAGSTGAYGRRLRAVVIGFGATARGAVTALNALGVYDVDVLTHRGVAAVAAPIHSARIVHFDEDTTGRVSHAVTENGRVPLAGFLAEHDIIVNCVLQDTDAPLMFMTDDGSYALHVFHKNNELAGYCSVLHALATIGSTGDYGRRLHAVVIGFGATARGAVTALNAHGVHDVDVLTHRCVTAVNAPIHSARIVHFEHDDARPGRGIALTERGPVPVAEFLAGHDIVVNCVLQDTDAPLTFLDLGELGAFAPGSLIIDVSCDEKMGFTWAHPTTFVEPTVDVGDHVHYYAVDHSPSYLWNSATWEISEALIPYLGAVLGGPAAWDADETIRRAVEIRGGVIQNPHILSFQHRAPQYPHLREFEA